MPDDIHLPTKVADAVDELADVVAITRAWVIYKVGADELTEGQKEDVIKWRNEFAERIHRIVQSELRVYGSNIIE